MVGLTSHFNTVFSLLVNKYCFMSVATTITSPIAIRMVATTATSPVVVGSTAVTTVPTITSSVVSVDLGLGLGADPSGSISVLYTGPFVPATAAPEATNSIGDIGDDSDEHDHNSEVSADDEARAEVDNVADNRDAVDDLDVVDNPNVVDSSDDSEVFDEGVNPVVHDSDSEVDSFNPSPFRGISTENAETWFRRFNNFCTYRF